MLSTMIRRPVEYVGEGLVANHMPLNEEAREAAVRDKACAEMGCECGGAPWLSDGVGRCRTRQ